MNFWLNEINDRGGFEGSVVSSPSESRRTTSRTAAVSQSEDILTSSPSINLRSSDYLDDLKFVK